MPIKLRFDSTCIVNPLMTSCTIDKSTNIVTLQGPVSKNLPPGSVFGFTIS